MHARVGLARRGDPVARIQALVEGCGRYAVGGATVGRKSGGAGGSRRRLGLTGPALGLLAEQRFTVGVTQLNVGDLLLGYTDGVVEAPGAEGAFGESRLLESLRDLQGSSEGLLQRIEAALDAFSEGAEASDDITMVALRRSGSAEGP